MSDVEHRGTYRYNLTPTPPRRSRSGRWVLGCCAALGLLLLTWGAATYFYGPLWLPDGWSAQFRGVEGAVRRNALIGLSKQEIISRYGAPTKTDKFSGWDMRYAMGTVTYGVDDVWLLLRLRSGFVISAEIRED